MTEDDINLLERATGIPCKNDVLIKKAQTNALALSEGVIVERVGLENLDAVLAICGMEPNGDKALAGAAAVLSEGGVTEPEDAEGALPEHISKLSLDDLEQMRKKELQKLTQELGLSERGSVKDLFERIGICLGLID